QKFVIPALCLAPLFACSESSDDGDDGSSGGACPYDYSSFDGTSPAVSLSNDLLGMDGTLRFSCAFGSTCHGSETNSTGARLYLGSDVDRDAGGPLTQEQIDHVHTNLVGKASAAAPGIQLVVPGKPEESFLMMKLDGCLEQVKSECEGTTSRITEHPCGSAMPEGSQMLPKAERDAIRAWIKQGAQNN
ncbi:MAG TPA: hypothetical protein VK524_34395, partial [Polyangiaceae bacterium]|nr:hypothetical protein [Polyangiaceae bacterium]